MSRARSRRSPSRDRRRGPPATAAAAAPARVSRRVPLGLLIASALFLAIAFVTYVRALDGAFLWDDDAHVTAPSLRSVGGLRRIWSEPRATQQYYPLTHSAFWIQYQLWGLDPRGYHAVNVVLHAAGALLAWRILERLAVPGALLAAAIFLVHPVHVESVAWITELKNTLSTVLYLAALLVYLRFDPPGTLPPSPPGGRAATRDWRLYALALALFVGALLSKTVTASLPAAILLIAWWKEGRLSWRRRAVPLIPFFVVGAALGLTTAWVERYLLGAQGEAFALTWLDRVLIAGRALGFYLGKLVWPADLVFIYPRWTIDRSAGWPYLYPAAAVAVAVVLWALRGRLGRGPLAAALFFGGTLVPALGFFNVYPFQYSFVADHFQYLASLGMIALAAALAATGLGRLGIWGAPLGHAACGALLLVLAWLAWSQAHIYRDLETLYRDTIRRNPGASMAYLNLGGFYWRQGRADDAIAMYRTVVDRWPNDAQAHVNLGIVYRSRGRHAEAMQAFRAALALKPDFAEAHYHLGLAHVVQGQYAEAIAEYTRALAIRPRNAAARQALGAAHIALGQYREGIEALNSALALDPGLAEAHYVLGAAYSVLGQSEAAVAAYTAAIAVRPEYAEAHNNLGIEHRKRGRLPEAIDAYRAAIASAPGYAPAYNNLGMAYAAAGRYTEAIEAWQTFVRLDPDSPSARAAKANIDVARTRLKP